MTEKVTLSKTPVQASADRRGFLRIAGATAFGGALGATLPLGGKFGGQTIPAALAQEDTSADFLARKNLDALIKHSDKTYETKRDYIGTSVVTANAIFFVRANLPEPNVSIIANPDTWEVSIEGVKNSSTLTVADLKKMGVSTVSTVLQCSGNGRAFFSHDASGSKWTVGAAGCALWSGVPLRTVVDALGGPADGVNFITGTGGEDLPAELDPKQAIVERSVPIDAMDNALLAWEMNGEPLPLAHGGPLRIIHPGYYGVNNVKYLKKLALTEAESDAAIMVSGYRLRPVDVKGAPDQPSMWKMDVKSFVTNPAGEVPAGKVQITGVAFSGNGPVSKVEVSVDGGQSWNEAQIVGPDLGEFAWRPFVLETELAAGKHMLTSRATDGSGETQPEDFPPNHRGYAHNGWKAHAIEVTAA
jgi:DMSO/TMAO reductase YedYZ molybdopterin-dependent catalytic subunit